MDIDTSKHDKSNTADLKIPPFNIICDKCNGTKSIPLNPPRAIVEQQCPKCKGTGYVDWIENIVGKKNFSILFDQEYECFFNEEKAEYSNNFNER